MAVLFPLQRFVVPKAPRTANSLSPSPLPPPIPGFSQRLATLGDGGFLGSSNLAFFGRSTPAPVDLRPCSRMSWGIFLIITAVACAGSTAPFIVSGVLITSLAENERWIGGGLRPTIPLLRRPCLCMSSNVVPSLYGLMSGLKLPRNPVDEE